MAIQEKIPEAMEEVRNHTQREWLETSMTGSEVQTVSLLHTAH